MPRPNFEGVPYLEVSKYPIQHLYLVQFTLEIGVKYYVKHDLSCRSTFSVSFSQRWSCNSVVNEENNWQHMTFVALNEGGAIFEENTV